MPEMTHDLPASDEEMKERCATAFGYDHIPRAAAGRSNWESQKAFDGMVTVLKNAFDAGGMYALVRSSVRIARRVVRDSIAYRGENREPTEYEVVGTATGDNGILERFGRGAVTEIFAERTLADKFDAAVLREGMPGAPAAPDGRADWEDAGWDVVIRSAHGARHVQVKATSKEPSDNAAKDASVVYWIPSTDGEYDFENARML